ncbi:hypothetical protein OU798_04505 [Prolixibacteraceae bacterium Z1-6]|uniref:Uncharacterized protein n=1 Tax=Draconibacterium aestuarii TaxID=2998507 RepID=A0A9X3FBM7_9BACT|nr:hypothetical protein [Prolixibacteraceae bacterium Z1-6]
MKIWKNNLNKKNKKKSLPHAYIAWKQEEQSHTINGLAVRDCIGGYSCFVLSGQQEEQSHTLKWFGSERLYRWLIMFRPFRTKCQYQILN